MSLSYKVGGILVHGTPIVHVQHFRVVAVCKASGVGVNGAVVFHSIWMELASRPAVAPLSHAEPKTLDDDRRACYL